MSYIRRGHSVEAVLSVFFFRSTLVNHLSADTSVRQLFVCATKKQQTFCQGQCSQHSCVESPRLHSRKVLLCTYTCPPPSSISPSLSSFLKEHRENNKELTDVCVYACVSVCVCMITIITEIVEECLLKIWIFLDSFSIICISLLQEHIQGFTLPISKSCCYISNNLKTIIIK